jgi:hypothetical protein
VPLGNASSSASSGSSSEMVGVQVIFLTLGPIFIVFVGENLCAMADIT